MPDLNRRDAIRLGLGGVASCASMAQDVARRTEGTRFLDAKRGKQPFQLDISGHRPHIFVLTADMVSPDHYHPGRPFQKSMELRALRSLAGDSVV
jgi:hypothetical protein